MSFPSWKKQWIELGKLGTYIAIPIVVFTVIANPNFGIVEWLQTVRPPIKYPDEHLIIDRDELDQRLEEETARFNRRRAQFEDAKKRP
ncbi:hypothetical protein NDN08_006579 [Rhodosorus marinus]|uniref:Uncharacterized protein n=1 Tax=Rhodosorus marinus TaxID=101924 RepID=A0AAV8UNC8_9RHOD|nr:hypothetical protein NDN08_006579 [Rhodosorus marinus]